MKYRICYKKQGRAKYISQLDFQKSFQRAMRRADLDLAFSEGFNPHPIMSYSPPVPLFAESLCEYVDITLKNDIPPQQVAEKISGTLPEGIIINSASALGPDDKALSKTFSEALYTITLTNENNDHTPEEISMFINSLYKDESRKLSVIKKNKKKKLVERDLRPMISDMEAEAGHECIRINAMLSCANDLIANPFDVANAFVSYISEAFDTEMRISHVLKTGMN